MAEQVVLTAVDGPVATVTINRPEKRNALNATTRRALIAALHALEADDAVRVVILTGAGEQAFVAGADIAEFAARAPVDQYRVMSEPSVHDAADRFPKPLIAAINGFCLGGGCELAMACDIRLAADTAKLGQPEVSLGLLPGGGATQRLPRLVGMGTAFKLLYTGELIGAHEAHRIGLVDEVVPSQQLMTRARALAAAIAAKSPVALRLIKEAVRASARAPLDEGIRLERALFGLAFASADKREGIQAFLDKRNPEFTGR